VEFVREQRANRSHLRFVRVFEDPHEPGLFELMLLNVTPKGLR
jgi:hypothetical protein